MIRDERQIEAEKQWAVNEALAKGIAEGEAKGKLEGKAEGKLEGRIDVARNMKALGIDTSVIAECTGLSEKQIEEL